MLNYPNIDPVIFTIPVVHLPIRWYSVSYIIGIFSVMMCVKILNKKEKLISLSIYDDIVVYSTFGMILGGRLFYVIFYNLSYYLKNIHEVIQLWNGGMSFHGGLIGTILAIYCVSKKHHTKVLDCTDMVAIFAPIGLFFGRIANFINGELYGRPTNAWVGMIFPHDPLHTPRHPSQLYEATLEGPFLFLIMYIVYHNTKAIHMRGKLSGIFLIGYGSLRFVVEFFREPDQSVGYLFEFFTMGQILSLLMIIIGAILLKYSSAKS